MFGGKKVQTASKKSLEEPDLEDEKQIPFHLLNMIDLTEHLAQEVSKVQLGGSWVDIPQDLFLHICIISHSTALIISFWL